MILQLQKKGRELSKLQCEQGPHRRHSTGQGSESRAGGPGNVPPTPAMGPRATVASWPRGSAAPLVLLECNFTRGHPHKTSIRSTKQVSILTKPVSALWEGHGMSSRLLSSPGTWAAWVFPSLRSGSTRRPLKAPLPLLTSLPSCWGGGAQ